MESSLRVISLEIRYDDDEIAQVCHLDHDVMAHDWEIGCKI